MSAIIHSFVRRTRALVVHPSSIHASILTGCLHFSLPMCKVVEDDMGKQVLILKEGSRDQRLCSIKLHEQKKSDLIYMHSVHTARACRVIRDLG